VGLRDRDGAKGTARVRISYFLGIRLGLGLGLGSGSKFGLEKNQSILLEEEGYVSPWCCLVLIGLGFGLWG
jgi:hypothetical protein